MKNIMQSYFKHNETYDRETKAAYLKEKKGNCFILQLIADHQGSNFLFREFRRIGPISLKSLTE